MGKGKWLTVALMVFVSTACSLPALSQTVYEVDPIVVTAERVSQKARDALSSLTVITRKEIDAMHARDLGEVLRLVPGLQVQQYGFLGNLAQLRLRGTESSHLLVMINGVEVNDPFFGGFDIAHISADEIERVEVVRGTQTALFGADAIGGVVNVILRESEGEGGFQIAGEAGGYGYRKLAAGLNGKEQSVSYALNLSHAENDGLHGRDAYRNTSASVVAKIFARNNTALSLGLLFTEYYKALPLSYYLDSNDFNYHQYIDPNNSQEGELVNGYAKFGFVWNERFKTEVRGAVSYNRLRNSNGPDVDASFENTSLNTKKLDLMIDERISLAGSSKLILSWQLQDESASRLDNSFYSSFTSVDKRIATSAVSASVHVPAGGWLSLLAGLRNDNPSFFSSHLSPQARVAISAPGAGTRFRAGWSRGFRVPTLSDLYFPDFGNPDLAPETAESFEAGIDQLLFFMDRFSLLQAGLSVVFFRLDISNMISYNERTWRTENIAEAHYSGFELEFSSLLGSHGLLRANYTHQRARGVKFDEESRLFKRPKDNFNLFIAFLPAKALELSAEYTSVGNQLVALTFVTHEGELVRAGDRLSGFSLLNVGATYTVPKKAPHIGESSVFLRVRNALNKSYEEIKGYSAPGRTFILGMRFII